MSKRQKEKRQRQFGKKGSQQSPKKNETKKHLIDPKHKNTLWTVIIVVVLLIFFIVNNTRDVPEEGPYPPNYNPEKVEVNSSPDN
jgi:hypothetical protein